MIKYVWENWSIVKIENIFFILWSQTTNMLSIANKPFLKEVIFSNLNSIIELMENQNRVRLEIHFFPLQTEFTFEYSCQLEIRLITLFGDMIDPILC